MPAAVHSLHAPRPAPPRLVFFEVCGRRDLAQRTAAALPGERFTWRRSWTRDPGAPRPSLLGGAPKVGLWLWPGTEQQLAEQATAVLLGFIHPLAGRDLPCCLGFPFAAAVFAPRRLSIGASAALDLEDIGTLLGVRQAPAAEPPARARPGAPLRPAPQEPAPTQPGGAAGPRRSTGPPPAEPPLDASQRAAVEHARGPARVLAPAGAGKTKTLVARVVRLIQRGAEPADILLLAFNRKAAEQLEERLAARGIATTRRLGTPAAAQRPVGVHCATFNAFGYRYQREVMGARVLLDQRGAELRSLMRRALDAAGISLAELKPPRGSDPVGVCLRTLTRVRAGLEAPGVVELSLDSTGDEALVGVPFAELHDHYVRAQAVTGRQSFDDQIYFAVADMLADPAHRAFIEARFRHVLVDEFQDLNPAQLALVDLLSRPTRDLFVVGDDDQLIYGWRQADPRGILQFHARMPPKPWSATYTLGTNYRCSRAVVASSARLVAHNRLREAKAVQPRTGAPAGALRFAGAPQWPRRAAAVCAFLCAEHARLGCDWRELAVLCRYRAQQFAVALALDEARIPRTPTLGCRLFTHPVARLLRAYIDLVRTPGSLRGDDLAFLLNRPTRYQTASFTAAVAAAERPWEHVRAGAATEPAGGPRPLSRLVEQVERLGGALRAPPSTSDDLVGAVITAFDLVEHWRREAQRARGAGEADGGGPFQVVDALSLLAQTYPEPDVCLAAWDRLRRDEQAHTDGADDTLEREQADDRVVIGTIHAAKGREYHAVVIPDYDADVSLMSPAELEEERRVLYVGVTRARDSALLTVDTASGWVQPFLRELVVAPEAGDHETLASWLDEEREPALREHVGARLTEIELLFPEVLPPPEGAAAACVMPPVCPDA